MVTHAYIQFIGDHFSPDAAEQATGLLLLEKGEPGRIGNWGQYRGKPVPYGMASLDAPRSVHRGEKLAWVLDRALPHIDTFRRLGADGSSVWVVEHFDDQINMAYSPSVLEKLARLGLPLCVSGYEVEQTFPHLDGYEPEG